LGDGERRQRETGREREMRRQRGEREGEEVAVGIQV
jgi:hypothetical protein